MAAEDALRARLLDRVAQSARQARPFPTVRRRDDHWLDVAPGAERKTLLDSSDVRRWLLRLAPGIPVPPSCIRTGENLDILVLDGGLVCGPGRLGQGDFLASEDGAAAAWKADRAEGALLYLRQSPPEDESTGADHATPARDGDGRWRPLGAGVAGRLLRFRHRANRLEGWVLLRCAPGGSIPEHPHRQDEEALMVSGDAFIGDVLLCAGDFQFAPGATAHGEITSEHGCVLFVHGALDPERWPTP